MGPGLKSKILHRNIVEATILTECAKGETVFVSRIPLIPNDLPFEFKRFTSLKAKLSNLQG
jgi:ATP-dependent DNA helicase PIF1